MEAKKQRTRETKLHQSLKEERKKKEERKETTKTNRTLTYPAEKGMYKYGSFSSLPSAHLSGMNFSGSGQYFG